MLVDILAVSNVGVGEHTLSAVKDWICVHTVLERELAPSKVILFVPLLEGQPCDSKQPPSDWTQYRVSNSRS